MWRVVRWLWLWVGLGMLLLLPFLAQAANLLVNGNFNDFSVIPGRSWHGYDEKVATGWSHFYIASGTRLDKLHWFSSTDFTNAFNPGGDPYELEGQNGSAQNIWSAYEFDAGIYQRVTGLTPGTAYAFDVPVVTFWRGPGYPDSDGVMKKWVGIDPAGGTDAGSPDVIWSAFDANDKEWVYMELAARAESDAMTFFVRVQAPENNSPNHVDLDMVYIDAAVVDLAPTVSLSVPATSDTEVSFSWVGSAAPGWSLKGVEVQYQDAADGTWQIVQGKTGDGNASFSFTGQAGHVYNVRARSWQTKAEAYNADIDMPGLWVEKSVTVGGAFAGYVRNSFGLGVSGALISTRDSSASSGSRGFYALEPLQYGQPYTLTAAASGYRSPPYVEGMVADSTSVTSIDFTLKPANDAIVNGDFEGDTSGWNQMGTGSAVVFSGDHRSGATSLRLTGPISLTQVVALSDTYNPTLSFWYKPGLADGDSFQISLVGSTASTSQTFTANGGDEWEHAWLSLNHPALYNGSLTVSFYLSGGQVFLDEVSLGDGPYMIFLPVVLSLSAP
ncbi:MAG: hypothetical protein Kow0063_04010 [Anaerolineae bacterium]